jgi:hypothetical protein
MTDMEKHYELLYIVRQMHLIKHNKNTHHKTQFMTNITPTHFSTKVPSSGSLQTEK